MPSFGFRAPGAAERLSTGVESCDWEERSDLRYFSLVVYPDRDVLAGTYRARLLPVFQPTTVSGLPAVRERASPEAPSCTITVGTADDQGLTATYDKSSRSPEDACDVGQQLVERIVAALPRLSEK